MSKCYDVCIPEFGIRLKNVLAIRKMPQYVLARKIGCDKDTINKYCNDYFYPTSSILKQICEALNCSADYLLELKDDFE